MYLQIYSVIWPYFAKCCALKMLWIFVFVVVCLSTFIITTHKSCKEDLKKSVLVRNTVQNIHGKISDLKQDLKTKELKSKKSNVKTLKICKKYSFATNNAKFSNAQQILIKDLKKGVVKMEDELQELEKEILLLADKRTTTQQEYSKQQEEYNKCMQVLMKK